MRPAGTHGADEIASPGAASTAHTTAHTTSIRPILHANMRRPRGDRGENPEARRRIAITNADEALDAGD